MGKTSRAVILWQKTPDEERLDRAKSAEVAARYAAAEARKKHAEMLQVGLDLVLSQLSKYLAMAQSPDFAMSIGPVDPPFILKLAEFISKNHRLDNGQATENIAHALAPSIDFSRLTQEERDAWRLLAVKGGAGD